MKAMDSIAGGMRSPRIAVLIVDPAGGDRETLIRFLEAWNFEPLVPTTVTEAIQMASKQAASIALACEPGTGRGGAELVRALREVQPDMEVVLLGGDPTPSLATEAFRAGAYDRLAWPLDFQQLSRDLNALREAVQRRMEKQLWESPAGDRGFLGIVGRSAPMEAVFAAVRRLAAESSPVLITGLVGTGKELVARALHQLSPRADAPLVIYRCCGVSGDMAERELFGCRSETMEPADRLAPWEQGVLATARGATLLLDEIGDLPLAVQPRLVEVFRTALASAPTNGNADSIRLLATSRFNLAERCQQRQFHSQLYDLLSQNIIHLPSLSERPEDIPLLCSHFLAQCNREYGKTTRSFSPSAERALLSYPWPGNVRELENVISRACLLADQDCIEWPDLCLATPLQLRPWPQQEKAAAENSARRTPATEPETGLAAAPPAARPGATK
ncbi:MAG TPA: sigma 54-interacting transcriptional regulator [Terriglobia bacterium]|nr:sigma 54-interacting transcriptional regulator [Terriglobia bacterium]